MCGESMREIKQFINKCYKEDNDNFCWYNTEKKLSKEEIEELKEYFDKGKYNFMLIINGCSELRPQRTFATFPIFLKGIDGCHSIFKNQFNTFILCSWLKYYNDEFSNYEKDINELLSTIPCELEVHIFRKNI